VSHYHVAQFIQIVEIRWVESFKIFFFILYFGFGSFFPLLSVHLKTNLGWKGFFIGVIAAMIPAVLLFFQPIWGLFVDWSKKPLLILTLSIFYTGFISFFFLLTKSFVPFLLITILFAIGYSAIIPLSDNLAVQYCQKNGLEYGGIRLYGSLGFGSAALTMGSVTHELGTNFIFIAIAAMLFLSTLFIFGLPSLYEKSAPFSFQSVKNLLFTKQFLAFLVVVFLIMGSNVANNSFFGILVDANGGTLTGIGIAFFVAVLSEIPFMKKADFSIHKWGIESIILIASIVTFIRFFLFIFEPSMEVLYICSFLQGMSI
jgi:PPP family 3-phenylpropionic acid transporter